MIRIKDVVQFYAAACRLHKIDDYPSTITYGSRQLLPGPAVVSAQPQPWSHFVAFPEMQAFSQAGAKISRMDTTTLRSRPLPDFPTQTVNFARRQVERAGENTLGERWVG